MLLCRRMIRVDTIGIVVGKEETTIVTDGLQSAAIVKRIAQIRLEVANTDSQFDIARTSAENKPAILSL